MHPPQPDDVSTTPDRSPPGPTPYFPDRPTQTTPASKPPGATPRSPEPTAEWRPEDLPLRPGDEPLSGYRLVRKLGKGGFGEVWEARAPGDFRVALKLVPLYPHAGGVELRALQIVKDVRHPNLLTVFGAWQTETLVIIGMELADRTLWDRFEEAVRQGQTGIPVRELLRYTHE